jgi:hypothetical protein
LRFPFLFGLLAGQSPAATKNFSFLEFLENAVSRKLLAFSLRGKPREFFLDFSRGFASLALYSSSFCPDDLNRRLVCIQTALVAVELGAARLYSVSVVKRR